MTPASILIGAIEVGVIVLVVLFVRCHMQTFSVRHQRSLLSRIAGLVQLIDLAGAANGRFGGAASPRAGRRRTAANGRFRSFVRDAAVAARRGEGARYGAEHCAKSVI